MPPPVRRMWYSAAGGGASSRACGSAVDGACAQKASALKIEIYSEGQWLATGDKCLLAVGGGGDGRDSGVGRPGLDLTAEIDTVLGFSELSLKRLRLKLSRRGPHLVALDAAGVHDTGQPFLKEASMAKLKASRLAVSAASEAVQIHGGLGYMLESPVARFYCDAKVLEIGEGTNEIQHMVIARTLGC